MRRRLLTTTIAVLLAVGGLLGIPLSVVAWWWVAENAHQDLDNRLKIVADQLIRQEGADGRIPPESLDRDAFELLLPPNGHLTVTFPDPTGTPQRTVVGAEIDGSRLSESIALGAAGTLTLSIPRDEVRNDQFTAASIVAIIVVASVIGGTVVAAVTAGRIVDPLTDLANRAATMGRGDFRTQWKMYGIAELDRVSRALADANAELALRLEREREVAGDASHQLRSRLTAIQLRLEELTLHDDPAVVTEAEAALDQIERLACELDDLVEASRADEPAPVFVDVSGMLTTLVGDFRQVFEARGRELVVTFDGVPHALTSNPGRLREAVSVLVDNALHHGRGTCRIHVGTLPAGDLVRITVADEGDGVADEIAAHIFRRGFSGGGRPGEGRSGVGLSLARALIESDGGRLELTVRRPPVFAIVVPARLVTGREHFGTDRGDTELAVGIDEKSGRSADSGVRRDRVPHR